MARTWEEIKKIADRNALYLDKRPDDFLDIDADLAEEALVDTLWLLLDDFETEDGRVKRKNLLLIPKLNSLFDDFAMGAGLVLAAKLVSDLQTVLKYNFEYYSSLLGNTKKFRDLKKSIIASVNKRIGINEKGNMTRDGYIDTLRKNEILKTRIREQFYRDVLSNATLKGMKSNVKTTIRGSEKSKRGAIASFYSQFAYDSFSQIDRMASSRFAEEYGLDMFIYYGTLIKTSRSFCRHKINGVYTVAEAKKWPYESPSPVGISNATYDPVIEMGGINCRHLPLFVTREMADEFKASK